MIHLPGGLLNRHNLIGIGRSDPLFVPIGPADGDYGRFARRAQPEMHST
jgi:hypothetical protein